ncbi:MAG: MarR family transcriptional regulator, partial [Alphaproteobacteria bacterium]|nr:MarR family transcriptional regulator [Alphaproteobacteria bacterium]
ENPAACWPAGAAGDVMPTEDKAIYGGVPLRAARDNRLSERHFRALTVIAAHYQFGRNGQPCTAGHERLAKMVGSSYQRLSATLADLVAFGYLERCAHPLSRRRRAYKVAYTGDDAAAMAGFPDPDSSPSGEVYGSPDGEVLPVEVPLEGNNEAIIVPHLKLQADENKQEAPQKIFPERVDKRLGKTLVGSEEPKPARKPASNRGTRLPEGWTLPPHWQDFAEAEGHPDPQREAAKFADYWRALPGQRGVKLDWFGTWRNWVRTAMDRTGSRRGGGMSSDERLVAGYRGAMQRRTVTNGRSGDERLVAGFMSALQRRAKQGDKE